MKTKSVGDVQVKGGAGRSTVATTLAGALSKTGGVALIDCDQPQGTAARWAAVLIQSAARGQSLGCKLAEILRDLLGRDPTGAVAYVVTHRYMPVATDNNVITVDTFTGVECFGSSGEMFCLKPHEK